MTFEVAQATNFPGRGYDIIAVFDCLHDRGDPVSTARRACQALKPEATVLLVEPMAGERVEDNFNPVGRV